jgi:hypothetical protein
MLLKSKYRSYTIQNGLKSFVFIITSGKNVSAYHLNLMHVYEVLENVSDLCQNVLIVTRIYARHHDGRDI